MRFSLIICTYKRPAPLLRLLDSVGKQEAKPDEILIIDGSPDSNTLKALEKENYPLVKYFQVKEKDRGLTRQRNFGIRQLNIRSEVVCFLDDDVVLEKSYFENLLETYYKKPDAVGVGGYILNEVKWEKKKIRLRIESLKLMDGPETLAAGICCERNLDY
ncbi:glycosyltransferase family 2 protein [Antarcticibacterium sp. 1MA-6-2]|uniref:glycosyltransferase family 2 protein n=1 Tax=Antarcticibacterium sp. 1MA-6-2 TaxID=2908210 RepID=UPI002882F1BD|nr:glycosyltransferase family 2 protein [Antarcticibacterium sp. 1MA-6-2]